MIALIRAYSRGGVGHTDTYTGSQHNILDSKKLTRFLCASDGVGTGVTCVVLSLESHALPTETPHSTHVSTLISVGSSPWLTVQLVESAVADRSVGSSPWLTVQLAHLPG